MNREPTGAARDLTPVTPPTSEGQPTNDLDYQHPEIHIG